MVDAGTIHAAVLKAYDAATHTATVQLTGGILLWTGAVPVAQDVASASMVVGRKLAVAVFDDSNPGDAVVLAVYV